MSLNFPEEARKLGGKPDRFGRKRGRLLEADWFDIELYVYDAQGDWNGLHTCGKDEFYILRRTRDSDRRQNNHPEGNGRYSGKSW